MQCRVALALVAVALLAAATAYGGSGADKAGGEQKAKPVVLTLAAHDSMYAYGSFAAAVERLSGGSIRLQIRNDWRDTEADYERGTIRAVRAGKVQMAIVGVRVWDTMG